MNEQIKRLQALATDNVLGIDILNAEKFAELIIQECIKELEATQVCDPYTGEQFNYYNDVLADGIASIKENFGVE